MGKIKVKSNVLSNAIAGGSDSLNELFEPFIKGESILNANYFGKLGVSIFGTHSFAAITESKVHSLQVGPFGQIIYQDGDIDQLNSGIIYQPKIFLMYLISILLFISLVGILLIPTWVRMYYRFNKSGLIWSVREGIPVYVFTNRNRIDLISNYWSEVNRVKKGLR